MKKSVSLIIALLVSFSTTNVVLASCTKNSGTSNNAAQVVYVFSKR